MHNRVSKTMDVNGGGFVVRGRLEDALEWSCGAMDDRCLEANNKSNRTYSIEVA